MGTRDRAVETDFSEVPLEEEVESQLKEAAVISMGTEVSGEDMLNIMALCDQVRSPTHFPACAAGHQPAFDSSTSAPTRADAQHHCQLHVHSLSKGGWQLRRKV